MNAGLVTVSAKVFDGTLGQLAFALSNQFTSEFIDSALGNNRLVGLMAKLLGFSGYATTPCLLIPFIVSPA